jgi:hypothetical protein
MSTPRLSNGISSPAALETVWRHKTHHRRPFSAIKKRKCINLPVFIDTTMARSGRFLLVIALVLLGVVLSFQPRLPQQRIIISVSSPATALNLLTRDTKEEVAAPGAAEDDDSVSAEEMTKKYGLEAGVFESLKKNDGESAKSLLKKYGIAYLATSIPLALVSFGICYTLVDSGVDVSALLAKVGIESSGMADQAGTVAIAYAAHKAASPIRFPPTVLLTPIVAKFIGKEPEEVVEE